MSMLAAAAFKSPKAAVCSTSVSGVNGPYREGSPKIVDFAGLGDKRVGFIIIYPAKNDDS